MNKKQILALATHQKTIGYLTEQRLRTGPIEGLAVELEECVATLRRLGAAQEFHTKERNLQVQVVARLRQVVRLRMLQVKRRAPKLLKGLAGVDAAHRVPHATAKTSILVTHADAMVKAVSPYTSAYIAARFPKDFLRVLRRDARDLERRAKAVPVEAKRLAQATAGIVTALGEAREVERAIDGTMRLRLDAREPGALAWTNAQRMGKVRGRRRKKRG